MSQHAAVIVIDTGFSEYVLSQAKQVLGICDLTNGRVITGTPFVDREALAAFAEDPRRHGTIVLEATKALVPQAPLVLVRAFTNEGGFMRTGWTDGHQSSWGWTEAYLWAAELCEKLGIPSVANCSFGGFSHAMDGTGWESFQLGRFTGTGKAGHILVAAAGPGDGRAAHASWTMLAEQSVAVEAYQRKAAWYNFWAGGAGNGNNSGTANGAHSADWVLEVWKDDELVARHQGALIPTNFWNGKKQLTFSVEGQGLVSLKVSRNGNGNNGASGEARFDCWVASDGLAAFVNHVDPTLIGEPAIFPQVLSVGLRGGSYSPTQALPGGKPDILLDGGGPISFRLPEVTAYVATLLTAEPKLDVNGVRSLLGKYPSCK